jgi:hypothetical protein
MPVDADPHESLLSQAQRAVQEGELRLARQRQILADITRDHVPSAADAAQAVLDHLAQSLNKAREHLVYLQSQQPPQ